jgi:hypothetical protein
MVSAVQKLSRMEEWRQNCLFKPDDYRYDGHKSEKILCWSPGDSIFSVMETNDGKKQTKDHICLFPWGYYGNKVHEPEEFVLGLIPVKTFSVLWRIWIVEERR